MRKAETQPAADTKSVRLTMLENTKHTKHTKHTKKQEKEEEDVRTALASVRGAAARGREF